MTNTALSAELLSASGTCLATTGAERKPQSTKGHKESVTYGNHLYDRTHMVFADGKQERFYDKKWKQVRYQDCYHKALVFILRISEDIRKHFRQIYDIKKGNSKSECLHEGWKTDSSDRMVRLAFHLYTDGTPGVKRREEQAECRGYFINDSFCCGYAVYF